MFKICKKHGLTKFRSEKANKVGKIRWRCIECNSVKQLKSVKRIKAELRRLHGDKCAICGYDKCPEALDFHHLNPAEKQFKVSDPRKGREQKLAEAKKCVLLCCRCHREVEQGITEIPNMVCTPTLESRAGL